jgi:hypothetical protein
MASEADIAAQMPPGFREEAVEGGSATLNFDLQRPFSEQTTSFLNPRSYHSD